MKRLALACTLLIIAVALLGLFDINLTFSSASAESVDGESTLQSEPTLQTFFDHNGYAINVTGDETGIEIFPAGCYKVTILAEIADYAPMNNLSWYSASNGQLNYIFYGENTTSETFFFTAEETFGFCLGSPDGYFFTESRLNEDEQDHALVFINPNATGYIIAWEDLWGLGDADFQDFVFAALTPVKVDVFYCPRTLNLKCKGRWITAIIRLPRDFEAEDVDVSSIMLNGTVPADPLHYGVYDCGDLHLIVLKFNRTAVIELIKNSLEEAGCKRKFIKVWLTVTGRFVDGLPFQGTNKIRVIHFVCHSHCASVSKELRCRFPCRPIHTYATLLRLLRVCRVNRCS